MPRISRSEPTAIFDRDSIATLSDRAYRAFRVCTALADDEGRLRCSARLIRSRGWGLQESPPTVDEIEAALAELVHRRELARYQVDGEELAQLLRWSEDQYISKPTPTRLPPPPETSGEVRRPPEKSGDLRRSPETSGEVRPDRDRDREGDQYTPPVPPCPGGHAPAREDASSEGEKPAHPPAPSVHASPSSQSLPAGKAGVPPLVLVPPARLPSQSPSVQGSPSSQKRRRKGAPAPPSEDDREVADQVRGWLVEEGLPDVRVFDDGLVAALAAAHEEAPGEEHWREVGRRAVAANAGCRAKGEAPRFDIRRLTGQNSPKMGGGPVHLALADGSYEFLEAPPTRPAPRRRDDSCDADGFNRADLDPLFNGQNRGVPCPEGAFGP